MKKVFQKTEAKSLLPYNDGGEARGKTEKRRKVGTFHTRMEVGSISLLWKQVYICDKEVASCFSVPGGGGAQLTLPERNWCELNGDLQARVMGTH